MKIVLFIFLSTLIYKLEAQPTERCEISFYIFEKDSISIFKPSRINTGNCNVGSTYENEKYKLIVTSKYPNTSIGFCNRIEDFSNLNYNIKDTTGIFTLTVNPNDSLCIQIIKKTKFGNKKMTLTLNNIIVIDKPYVIYLPFKQNKKIEVSNLIVSEKSKL